MALCESTKQFLLEDIKIDMTPMIDVTFQLLIFFMCTLQFVQTEGALECYLPKDIGVFSSPPRRTAEEPFYVKLIKDEGSKEVVIWAGDNKLKGASKYNELYNFIREYIAKTPNAPVIIDPEINVAFQDIISTLNACRRVQLWLDEETKAGRRQETRFEIKFSAKALADK